MTIIGLALLFLLTAAVYASVGFGGGSTYTALLVLAAVDYRAIPVISLTCNLAVVGLGCWRFARAGALPWRRCWPLLAASVPLAWLGGRMVVPQVVFIGLLSLSLMAAALAMLWRPAPDAVIADDAAPPPIGWREPLIGAGLGLLAGITGIGGGIFLAPLLHLMRWGRARDIAGTAAAFILVNSLAGLAGQLTKHDGYDRGAALAAHWPLLPAVVVGGLVGSALGSRRLTPRALTMATAILVLYAGGQLAYRFVTMVHHPS